MNLKQLSNHFKSDLSDININDILSPKKWDELYANHPAFLKVEEELKNWLTENCPTVYQVLQDASTKTKKQEVLLFRALKLFICFGQKDFVGLRSKEIERLNNLIYEICSLCLKRLNKIFDKTDFSAEMFNLRAKISPAKLFSFYSDNLSKYEEIYEQALAIQPDCQYISLVKNLNLDIKKLRMLQNQIDEIDFDPSKKDQFCLCACCFRWVKPMPSDKSKVTYHGYKIDRERKGYNHVTSDTCVGAEYPSLEVSAEGTLDVLKLNARHLKSLEESLEKWTASEDPKKHKEIAEIKIEIGLIQSYSETALNLIKQYHPDQVILAESYL